MPLVKCGESGREVSDRATACPQCGQPLAPRPDVEPHVVEVRKKSRRMLMVIGGLAVAAVIIVLIVVNLASRSAYFVVAEVSTDDSRIVIGREHLVSLFRSIPPPPG